MTKLYRINNKGMFFYELPSSWQCLHRKARHTHYKESEKVVHLTTLTLFTLGCQLAYQLAAFSVLLHKKAALLLKDYASDNQKNRFQRTTVVNHRSHAATIAILPPLLSHQNTSISHRPTGVSS